MSALSDDSSEEDQQTFLDRVQTMLVDIDEITSKCEQRSEIRGMLKLIRRIRAEKKYLTSLKSGPTKIGRQHYLTSNVYFYKIFVEAIAELPNVVAVLEVFTDTVGERITVDIICDEGNRWVKIFARNPQALHLSCYGYIDKSDRSVLWTARRFLETAKTNPYQFNSPKVEFRFGRGVTERVKIGLESIGIVVTGNLVELTDATRLRLIPPSDWSSDESDTEVIKYVAKDIPEFCKDRVNLDVSTLIGLVSELTHGGHVYQFTESALEIPARLERAKRLLPILYAFFEGKEKLVCKTALEEFQEIVDTVGGPKEKQRAEDLLKTVTIVEDQPSARAMALVESSRIRDRTKVIFGTGDTLRVLTVTSNMGFVRAAAQQGVPFAVYIHDSFPLTLERFLKTFKR